LTAQAETEQKWGVLPMREQPHRVDKGRFDMILATTKVEDYERFLAIFSTKGAEKRRPHRSKGVTVFRDPSEDDRVWALFDWDLEGWKSFVSDPEVPAVLRKAGTRRTASRSRASAPGRLPHRPAPGPR
jgi:hypothetical protein